MKPALPKIIIAFLLLIPFFQIKSQSNTEQKKIEVILQLEKFIDWSVNTEFSNTSRELFVISNSKPAIELENWSKSYIYQKKWTIIFKESLEDIKNGSIIYVTKNKKQYIPELIRISQQMNILTIADNQERFCENGGMINIIDDKNKIRFELNYKIIQNKSLNISSKVLALAKIYD